MSEQAVESIEERLSYVERTVGSRNKAYYRLVTKAAACALDLVRKPAADST